MVSECSFTTCKLRFFDHFCLDLAASLTLFNALLGMTETQAAANGSGFFI
jgi:hypothetical protein